MKRESAPSRRSSTLKLRAHLNSILENVWKTSSLPSRDSNPNPFNQRRATQRNDPQRWQGRGIKIAGRLITFSTHCSFRRGGIDRVRTQSHASALFVNRVNDSRQHGTLIVPGSTMEATDRRCTPKNWKNRAGRGLKGRKREKGKKKPIARLIESADVTRWYFPSSIVRDLAEKRWNDFVLVVLSLFLIYLYVIFFDIFIEW